jgi:pyridoxal phosphate enzyme (YggS family)
LSYQDVIPHIPKNVKLVAVTKNVPVEDISLVYELGCRDFGENRVQDALPKIEELPPDIRWHFIGTLQKNKVKKVVGNFALIHSVDSVELAQEISKQGIDTSILLQVNTSGEESKQGFTEDEFRRDLAMIQKMPYIQVKGLMTMAPLTEDVDQIRMCFRRLRELRDELGLKELSMGMSHDYKIAIEEGATIVRIGSAIFS